MIMIIIISLMILLGSISSFAATPFFSSVFKLENKEKLFSKFPKGAEFIDTSEGGGILKLDRTVRKIVIKPIPVTPGKKCRLSLTAKVDARDTVEFNDRIHIMRVRRYWRGSTSCELRFFDADGKPAGAFRNRCPILTSNWHDYVDVFYIPSRARTMTVTFAPAKRDLFLKKIELAYDSENGALNCNPEFSYGDLNYCEWHPARAGRLYTRPDGKTVFSSGYGGSSPRFPMEAGVPYNFFCRGIRRSGKGWMTLTFYNNKGRRIANRFLLRPKQEGVAVKMTPPPGTKSGAVVMYGLIIEELKVTQVGDKSAVPSSAR